jgi:hypothetical protein
MAWRRKSSQHQRARACWYRALFDFAAPDRYLIAGGGYQAMSCFAGAAALDLLLVASDRSTDSGNLSLGLGTPRLNAVYPQAGGL